MRIALSEISPTNCDIAIVVGGKFIYNYETEEKTAFALRCAIKDTTDTFLVKLPVKIGIEKYKELYKELYKNIVVGVTLTNPCIRVFHFDNKIVYTGTATDFMIIRRKKQ